MEDEQPAREANKICGVCGDRALGYNFNAVSCESCKAFFRRNALKNKDFRCPFTENCVITPVTRRFCQKCRLDKCFGIGMRKEYIMSEEDKVLKRQKIEQNRAKKRSKADLLKDSKNKKDIVDEENIEDTSMSVNSITSNISETYFWESDGKYPDIDCSKQMLIDNMSPTTATSVPSPSTPPENIDITETQTLDIAKGSSHCMIDFIEFEQQSSFPLNDQDIEKKLCSKSLTQNQVECIDKSSHISQNLKEDNKMAIDFEENLLEVHSPPDNSNQFQQNLEETCQKLDQELSCTRDLLFKSYEQSVDVEMETQLTVESLIPNHANSPIVKTSACETPKGICSSQEPQENDMVAHYMQDPTLITKFISKPNLVAKIFQDMSVILKVLANPDVVKKLAIDPQISQIVKENNGINELMSNAMHSANGMNILMEGVSMNDKESNEISDSNIIKPKETHIKNPILTDLITNGSSEKQSSIVREPSISNHHSNNKNINDVMQDVLQDVQRIPIMADSIESILCKAIKLEYSAYSSLSVTPNNRELNDAERAKLNELIVANKALLAPLEEDITNLIGDECKFKDNFDQSDPMLLDVINLTAIAIRRLIKMSKKISAFKNMCQEDQLALLKGGCTEMMILRSAVNYDPDKDSWKILHSQDKMSNIKADVLKEAKGNLYAEHAKFVRTFDPRWKDENIILILCAIALFTPDRPRVVHSDVVKLEQNSYYYLLRRYLESVYPGCEAKSMFLKLIQKISELHRLNDEVVGVYLNVNPSSVEPLLIEIFDLKH